jgi:hypothetical protein
LSSHSSSQLRCQHQATRTSQRMMNKLNTRLCASIQRSKVYLGWREKNWL